MFIAKNRNSDGVTDMMFSQSCVQVACLQAQVIECDRLVSFDDPADVADSGNDLHHVMIESSGEPATTVACVLALLPTNDVLGQRNLAAVVLDQPMKQVLLGRLDDGCSRRNGNLLLTFGLPIVPRRDGTRGATCIRSRERRKNRKRSGPHTRS